MATIHEGGSFETFNDVNGNALIALNRDGTVLTNGIEFSDGSTQSTAAPAAGAWSALTGTLSNGQVIPYADTGISRIGPTELSVGNGTNGDFTGSLLATNVALGLYSGGGQGHMGQINGITQAGNFPPMSPYGSAIIDVGTLVTSTPLGSAMGVNSAIAVQNNTHNIFALNGELASPIAYSGNLGAGLYCVYGEVDHNGTGTMNAASGHFGAVYNEGNGKINIAYGGYFESLNNPGPIYSSTPGTTGIIVQNVGLYVRSGGANGTLGPNNDTTVVIDSPMVGATFTNLHIGLRIADQTNFGALPNAYALKIEGSNNYVDLGGNVLSWNGTDSGISRLAAGSLAIGTGGQGSITGKLTLGTEVLTAATPTVAAGQVGFGTTTKTTIGANGGATGLTALPVGYLEVNIGGTMFQVPYYNI
jgi:hypothetical protein